LAESDVSWPRFTPPSSLNRWWKGEPVGEFVYFLVRGDRIEQLMQEHVRKMSGRCEGCGRPWPCNWLKLADQALQLRYQGFE
jgi:hypothetical protein